MTAPISTLDADERPILGPATAPRIVVFVDPALAGALEANRRGVIAASSRVAFRRLLDRADGGVVVISLPPASLADVEAAATIRGTGRGLRVLVVNEPADVAGRLRALELGVDEALPHSIGLHELVARVELLCSRHDRQAARRRAIAITSEVRLDVTARAVRRGPEEIHLRPKELALLTVLATHPGRAFSRTELLDLVWGDAYAGDARTVDVHVRWLRSKLEPDPARPRHVRTVRGHGYRFDPPTAVAADRALDARRR